VEKYLYGGASVRGAGHIKNNVENQDAYSIREYKFGVVLVVADGLGSKEQSSTGSQAVCKSVCEGIEIWNKKGRCSEESLILLIHNLWRMNIYPYTQRECGTTCLFAVHFHDGEVLLAQIGDGMISYIQKDEFNILHEKDDEFGNFTNSIDQVKNINEWTIKSINTNKNPFKIMLATDGVSEDLIPEKRRDLLCYLTNILKNEKSYKKRNLKLKNILKNWLTKHTIDDKTIVVFEYEVSSNEG
jgi:serine/threonine protein phosphatase PrpC